MREKLLAGLGQGTKNPADKPADPAKPGAEVKAGTDEEECRQAGCCHRGSGNYCRG